jgi:hypothetical protein
MEAGNAASSRRKRGYASKQQEAPLVKRIPCQCTIREKERDLRDKLLFTVFAHELKTLCPKFVQPSSYQAYPSFASVFYLSSLSLLNSQPANPIPKAKKEARPRASRGLALPALRCQLPKPSKDVVSLEILWL